MPNAQELIDLAERVAPAGEEVLAAGVFAVQDDHIANALGALGGSAVADELLDNPVAEGAGAAAGIHAARAAHAASEVVSLRMLVAVTQSAIRLYRLGTTGETPGAELMAFDRASCEVELGKFGAAEHITLRAGDNAIALTGGIGLLATYKDGNKRVVAELSG